MKHKKILVAISVIGIAVTISICAFSCGKKHEQKNQKQNSTISLEKDKKKDTSEYALSVEKFLDSKPEYKKPYIFKGIVSTLVEYDYDYPQVTFHIQDEEYTNVTVITDIWGINKDEIEELGIFEEADVFAVLVNDIEHEDGEQSMRSYDFDSVRIDLRNENDKELTKSSVKLFTDPQQADQAYEELLNEYEKGKEKNEKNIW